MLSHLLMFVKASSHFAEPVQTTTQSRVQPAQMLALVIAVLRNSLSAACWSGDGSSVVMSAIARCRCGRACYECTQIVVR